MLFEYCNCEIRCRLSGYVRNSYVAAQNKRFTDVCVCVCVCAAVLLTALKVKHEHTKRHAIISTCWKPGPIKTSLNLFYEIPFVCSPQADRVFA
jgi:hypothetical protein